ncbi:MAG: diguanylate cyclase [Gammaproteobacteria bacterium]|jgi:hemerythrin|nr:diguanylate cyclase [Gammaproteobacteria bacterium]MBT3724301.1 diguanylate cyclase [Gammaproteobacteria bacterium]MBT4075242.1 diguanylate cyclase [Gammaproteobacteria bacterium]MBT4196686.1 diguanylate cyclase [Gammaproteobacteria bacterium]MBT4448509.1 diguanylate cyclase [Gammaproteobacteria bacterium]
MQSFKWDKNYVTGLAEVDEQHLYLVDRINQFGHLLAENKYSLDDLTRLFKELADYAIYHFDEEQQMMLNASMDSRHFDKHIQVHNDFLQEVTALFAAVSDENTDAVRQLLDFLIQWLAYHILGTDQNMSRQLAFIKSGLSPEAAYEKEEREADSATEPLLKALNSLFHQVSARNKDLLKLNQTLEAKVAERTKALSDANIHLEELALTDTLTDLPNRRHAMRLLDALWTESIQNNKPLSCMMIDADHFKEVNDTYGHDAGDVVLKELAKTLQHSYRNDDIVCRLGGDEFLVICPDTDHDGGLYIAEIVCKTVSSLKVPTGDGFWNSSISVGVATREAEMNGLDDLIKVADKGVYAAKQDGKNCVRSIA